MDLTRQDKPAIRIRFVVGRRVQVKPEWGFNREVTELEKSRGATIWWGRWLWF